jgi:bacillithiol system protein YtxJ
MNHWHWFDVIQLEILLKLQQKIFMNWNKITDLNQLETIKAESYKNPVLLFKHSTTCSISNMALNRLERNYDQTKVGSLKPYYLDLLSHRDISKHIAELFEVEHQSPQAIIVSNGEAVYNASHYDISFAELVEKV